MGPSSHNSEHLPPAKAYWRLHLHSSDLRWLHRYKPASKPPRPLGKYRLRIDNHEYNWCRDPVPYPRGRECQLIQPLITTQDMLAYITHPDNDPPTSFLPKTRAPAFVDRKCQFCRGFPKFGMVDHMCAFHMMYFAGARTNEDLCVLRSLNGVGPKSISAPSPTSLAATVVKSRDLLVGSTPETDGSDVSERRRRANDGEFGHVGQARSS
ncbi:uncharacterized protein F4822DRAFT_4606 [Hypoxylon trugodes]|uniref:uncharacterized protein n=1 Tax=Hypoxylon trugodes TaxID=326681 RepID=UPI002192541F|nr:uncharacterized protein F4822DRAFT_4606 [Hypoxylon trugodes]KAI1393221.1 hypothetical protein F4822DRAFT_4606 [Hypoxylon trugodes]